MKSSKTTAVYLPTKLVKDARTRIEGDRELELETYLEIHLRVMLRSKNVLRLTDALPFGKYSGEMLENIVRADPGYVAWLVGQNGKTTFEPEVLALVNELMSK